MAQRQMLRSFKKFNQSDLSIYRALTAEYMTAAFERMRSNGTNGMSLFFRLTIREETSMPTLSLLKRRLVRHRTDDATEAD